MRMATPCPTLPAPSLPFPAKGEENEGAGKMSWLALEPLTGRTHQLRVHCAALGWPILGDVIYGTASRKGCPILHLHAREVAVPLYKNRAPIRVVAPIPPHMRAALAQLGWRDEEAGSARGSPP